MAAAALVDLEWRQASTRLLPATDLTIAGIVKHLAWAEDRWFQGRLLGVDMPATMGCPRHRRPRSGDAPGLAVAGSTLARPPGTTRLQPTSVCLRATVRKERPRPGRRGARPGGGQGWSDGVGNLGVWWRNGRKVWACSQYSVTETRRAAATPATTVTASGASAACSPSTAMAAASAASTVATMVGVLTRKWIHTALRVGPSTM
ncbi:MAG: hypothetical protein ACRD2C_00130 [Acidimicrobiales bacterium]